MVMGKIKLEMNSECGVSGISLDQNACVIVANNPEDIVADDDDDDMTIIIINSLWWQQMRSGNS